MREVLDHLDGVRAVVFDVDGTLYRQSPVRRAMIARLARAHAARPATGVRVMKVIAAYRRAQEELRAEGFEGDVTAAQLDIAAARAGVSVDVAAAAVEQWMEVSPLDVVARSARTGLLDVLDALAASGISIGAVSDYPARRKLEALGIADRFGVVVSAQDPQVQAFKPNPKGLFVALGVLGVAPSEALYVGDRVDVDAPAARAADVRCVIVGGARDNGGRDRRSRRRPDVAETLEAT